jgi:hypothetical protein
LQGATAPIDLIKPQRRDFAAAHPVDRKQHQNRSVADVTGLVGIGLGQNPSHIGPLWSTWYGFVPVNCGSSNRHSQAGITHAEHRRVAQECPQRRRGMGDRNARPSSSCPFVNEVAVDVAWPQCGQSLIGLLAPLKECPCVGVPSFNGLSAQSSFIAHPSRVLIELMLKLALDDGSAPPA